MSNLDDVIKDILGNMFYDRSKTISEQIAADMGGKRQRQIQNPEKLDSWNQFRGKLLQMTQPAGKYDLPIKFRGIQERFDILVPSSKKDLIRVDEFHNTQSPFDNNLATKLFGPWCKAISSGNMIGTSGEDYWYDTTDAALSQCSATTEYSPRYLLGKKEYDPIFGLKDVTEIPTNIIIKQKDITLKTASPADNTRVQDYNTKRVYNPKVNLSKSIKESRLVEDVSGNFDARAYVDEMVKKNPRWAPFQGWGIYKKNWDFVAESNLVGKIVRLPISPVTGRGTYKVYERKCLPLNYDQCLQISWSLLNANAQPNGMKKFSILTEKNKETLSTYIACTSTKGLEKSSKKNEDSLYPWFTRYDGYCFALDGQSCEDVSFDEKGKRVVSNEPCITKMEEITSGLDIRDNTINLPGNRIGFNRGEDYNQELYNFYNDTDPLTVKGRVAFEQCKGYYGEEYNKCLNDVTKNESGDQLDIDDVGSAAISKHGMIVIGKI